MQKSKLAFILPEKETSSQILCLLNFKALEQIVPTLLKLWGVRTLILNFLKNAP